MRTLFSLAVGVATVAALSVSAAGAASAGTVFNTSGGDGFVVVVSPTNFDLFGSDNGASDNFTVYSGTTQVAETLSGSYIYTTLDCCGAFYDPAGAFVTENGVTSLLQLSPTDPDDLIPGLGSSGTITFTLNAGDQYGFYVFSADSAFGRGDIAVTGIAVVPEPAAWAFMLVGFGGLGALARRRRSAIA